MTSVVSSSTACTSTFLGNPSAATAHHECVELVHDASEAYGAFPARLVAKRPISAGELVYKIELFALREQPTYKTIQVGGAA
jgi:hypothetical protein